MGTPLCDQMKPPLSCPPISCLLNNKLAGAGIIFFWFLCLGISQHKAVSVSHSNKQQKQLQWQSFDYEKLQAQARPPGKALI